MRGPGAGLALAAGDRLGVRTLATAGSRENLELLARGEVSFALASADVVEAYLIAAPGADSIRAVARLYDSYVHLVVSAGDEVHRLADLRGQRVAVGAPGSGDGLAVDRILAAAGIDPTTDITRVELGPREGIEYKYRMEKGASMVYSWTSTGRVNFDFHGEPRGAPQGYAESYQMGEGQSASGSFFAPTPGIHGWFWENLTNNPITVKLTSTGFYEGAIEFTAQGQTPHDLPAR